MARIQVFQGGNIQQDDPRVVPIRAPQFETGAVGEGIQRLGEAGQQAAGVIDRINAAHDEAATKEALNAVSQHFAEVGYTGPNAYFGKQGKDALDLRPTVEKDLDSIIAQTRAGLKGERQQFLFDEAIDPQRTAWQQSIAAHALKETRTYAIGESTARAGMTGELARFSYFDNPEEGEKQLDTMEAEIAHRGELEGWGPDQVKAEQLKARSGAYKDLGARLAIDGGDQGPELARAFIEKHRDSMTGDDASAVGDRATIQQNHLDALRRQEEADARREAREAQSDARDHAESGLSRLDDGTPLSTEEYAGVLDAAKASGDDQLVKRVQDAQFKNGLTLQYANATPPELQDRINTLAAGIAKAGTNAKHEDILERDTLQGILGKTSGQVGNDPLAWGAAHLGVDVQPLDLNNRDSITSRVNSATTIAKRLGRPPQPLTASEAKQFSSVWTGGNTGQKTTLVMSLANLGALAGSAASQIAPNDAGFANAVGLATLSNRSVAADRVNRIMTGQEALKTKPKLIERDTAVSNFNAYIGGALQFLPQAKAGVYQNAVAILASQANEHGWNEWADASPAWFRSVNMALGAYTGPDGKNYGGLMKLNGGVTIIPEGMDQGTFETKISRAIAPQLKKASGMQTPIYADGKSPTASEIKRMQWIPIGDGRYRVSDGHGFVRTTGGGFYEIDARKL